MLEDGLIALLQKHAEELEVERAAHRDALALCEVYEERIAELVAARWEPVPDGDLVPTITDGEMWAYERDGKLGKAIVVQRGNFHGDIILADGYAVCRLVADDDAA